MILETNGNTINTKLIYDYMEINNPSKSAFCKVCHISTATLKKVLSGSLDFGTIALFKIATTLGLGMHQMFE